MPASRCSNYITLTHSLSLTRRKFPVPIELVITLLALRNSSVPPPINDITIEVQSEYCGGARLLTNKNVIQCYTMGKHQMLRFFDSAFKHGLSEDQIRQSLADPLRLYEELPDDEDGNPQDLTIGKTHAEVVLEVGVKYKDDHDCVFHADEANAKRKDTYNKRRR